MDTGLGIGRADLEADKLLGESRASARPSLFQAIDAFESCVKEFGKMHLERAHFGRASMDDCSPHPARPGRWTQIKVWICSFSNVLQWRRVSLNMVTI